jgi:carbon storage regulator
MLVLSRRPGESFLIGDDIEIVILGSEGAHVKVGIRAPRDILIVRKELLEIQARNSAALALPSPEKLHASLITAEGLLRSRP